MLYITREGVKDMIRLLDIAFLSRTTTDVVACQERMPLSLEKVLTTEDALLDTAGSRRTGCRVRKEAFRDAFWSEGGCCDIHITKAYRIARLSVQHSRRISGKGKKAKKKAKPKKKVEGLFEGQMRWVLFRVDAGSWSIDRWRVVEGWTLAKARRKDTAESAERGGGSRGEKKADRYIPRVGGSHMGSVASERGYM
jgi:hypothetical protein